MKWYVSHGIGFNDTGTGGPGFCGWAEDWLSYPDGPLPVTGVWTGGSTLGPLDDDTWYAVDLNQGNGVEPVPLVSDGKVVSSTPGDTTFHYAARGISPRCPPDDLYTLGATMGALSASSVGLMFSGGFGAGLGVTRTLLEWFSSLGGANSVLGFSNAVSMHWKSNFEAGIVTEAQTDNTGPGGWMTSAPVGVMIGVVANGSIGNLGITIESV